MRKSIGAQIRSVFNVTDPLSREFSDDSDDETLVNQSFNPNFTQDSQASIDYLAIWSTATKAFVHNETQLNRHERTDVNITPNSYNNSTYSDNVNCKAIRSSSPSMLTPQEHFQEVNLGSNTPDVSMIKESVDAKFNPSLTRIPNSTDLRQKVFQGFFQQRLNTLDSSLVNDIIVPDTPEDDSLELFKDDTQIIPESDVSVISNHTQQD